MAYQSRAFGEVVYNVGINDVKARKAIQLLNRDLRNQMKQMAANERYFRAMGDMQGLLSHKFDDLGVAIERNRKVIKQYQETIKNSDGADAQAVAAVQSKLDAALQKEQILQRQRKGVQIQMVAERGELEKLTKAQEEEQAVRESSLKLLEAEGKSFAAVRKRMENYGASIEDVNAKLAILRKGLREMDEQGLTGSVRQKQVQEINEALAEKAKIEAAQAKAEKEKPVDYAKIRRERDVIPQRERMDTSYDAQKESIKALKATGDEGAYSEAQAELRLRRMADLKKQIDNEQQSFTKALENTDLGDEINTNIAKMRTEYSELEDAQRRYSEGLENLNWTNQKNMTTMKAQTQMLEATGQHFRAQMVEAGSLRDRITILNDQYERERVELSALSDKYGENSSKVTDQSRKVSELATQMVTLRKRLVEVDRSTGGAYGKLEKFADYANQHQKGFNAVGTAMTTAGKGMVAFGGGVGFAIAQGTKLKYTLDQTNNTTKALLDNAGREDPSEIIKNLSEAKKEDIRLSQQYGISQNEIAQAQQTLAHRGYESNQVLGATKPLLQSAIATGYDLKDVTNIATSAVEAFGLRSRDTATMTKNTTKAINTMSYASDLSASSFNDTGVALSYVGATAKAAGVSMDQTAAAVGELSLNGIGAQKAGTGLRKILQSLISPTANGKKAIDQLGLSFTDNKGKLKPFNEIIEDLHGKLQGMSKVQQVDILKKIFGTTGQTAAAALVNNADALTKFNKEVAKANGDDYIGKLSKQKLDNPINQINRLKAAWQEMAMQMASTFAPAVTGSIKALTDVIEKINNMGPGVKAVFEGIAVGVPLIGLILVPLGMLIRNIQSIASGVRSVRNLFSKSSRDEIKNAQSLNDTLIEQIGLMKQVNKQVATNNELNYEGNAKGGSGNSGGNSNLGDDINDLKKEKGAAKDVEEAEKVGKASRWERLMSRFGGVSKTGTRFGKVGEGMTLAEDGAEAAGSVGKFSKIAKIGGAGIAGIDVATSLLNLIGTNRTNYGSKIGDSTGSLAGAGLGGLAGSFAGPVGTAIGAAIGSTLGSKIGSTVGQSIQRAEEADRKKFNYKQSYHSGLTGDGNSSYDNLSKVQYYEDQLNNLKAPDKNAAKYKDNKAQYKADLAEYKSYKSKLIKEINDTYSTEEKLLDKHVQKEINANQKGVKNVAKILGLSQNDIKNSYTKFYNDKQTKLQKDIAAEEKAVKKGGKETTKQRKKIESDVADILGGSVKKQKSILTSLQKSSKQISDKQAGQLIANAHKTMKSQISSANKAYKSTKSKAKSQYSQSKNVLDILQSTGKISSQQYKKALGQIKENRDNQIGAAYAQKKAVTDTVTDQYNETIKWTKKRTKDHLSTVDEETGKVIGYAAKQEKAWDKAHEAENNYNKGNHSFLGSIWSSFTSKVYGLEKDDNRITSNASAHDWWGSAKAIGKTAISAAKTGAETMLPGLSAIPGFSEGSNAIKGNQQALVNEKGMESAYNPKTNSFRLFKGGPQLAQLFDGEHVLNAQDTYKLTHGGLGQGQTLNGYADGTTSLDDSSDVNGKGSIKLKNVKALDKFKKKSAAIWKDVHDDTKDKVDKTHDHTIKQLTDMKKGSLDQFQNIHDSTLKNTKDLVTNYNTIFGQLPGMTQNSVRGSIDQLNRGFSGINQTLNQFGSKTNVLQPIHYAAGSGGAVAREHDAIVNDAMSGNQQEAILRSDGIFLPKYRNAMVHLNQGDAVLNGSQTKQFLQGTGIAHYADGTGVDVNQLKKLIAYGLKNPLDQLNKDFGSKVGQSNTNIGKGFTDDTKGALDQQMKPWYQAIWQVINSAAGNDGTASAFLKYAKANFTGKDYSLGADGPDLYDCSSMVEAALKHFGIQLGRTTTAMQASNQLTRLGSDRSKARPGDLVLFGHGDGAAGHVGIVDNPTLGTMFNETPPAAGVTNIDDVTSVALDGYYRINGLANKDTKKSPLFGLAKKQLGKQRLDWIAKNLGLDDDFGGAIPTGDHASLLKAAGIPQSDWADYNYIISHESGWNPMATNPNGGAYGLPQSLPANKMASAGFDWRTNPVTQLKWMKSYVASRYGSADNARAYWQAHHNYENGGLIMDEQIAKVGEHNKPEMILPLTDKYRTVQLAKQAVDFVTASDRNGMKSNSSSVSSQELERRLDAMSDNLDKVVDLLNIVAKNTGLPTKAYITRQDIFKTINDGNQKSSMQSALRRGENIVQ